MLKVAICDDEAAEVSKIESFLRAYDDFDIAAFSVSKQLALEIENGAAFDLYILDIIMPPPDGIELARIIRNIDETAAIIYLTSHNGRALDAFRVRASQYLTKPVTREMFLRELDTALSTLKARKANTFLLKTKEETINIPFHRIIYCELENRTICCVTSDGKKQRSVTLREPFEEAVSVLLEDNRFICPHISFAVNMDYVKSIKGNSLLMKNGANIPIAHRAASEIKEKYLRHFFKGGTE